ncbi:uncharacterized protein LOC126995151 [Eriocheir sinensis]|uniref:uncharacterized protein LOC126995151 n=1 Tax=Eriocheir sinensis TaxID=95602 RepID=UPI0021C81C0B|nr:uncharacterized protein LOC126995151 [Eriocheir sinensis]
MPRGGSTRKRNSGRDMDESDDWWDVMFQLGMPVLYILGIITGIIGTICQGVITEYWSNLEPAVCFLYAKTATSSVVYTFGSALAVCNWVTYGGVVAIIIAFISGLVYTIQVRTHKDLTISAACSVTGILVTFLLMLAVTCTMAEGMRITCTSMGLNSANNKGESCYEKLDKRALGEQLPVQTSTMVRSAMVAFIGSTVIFFIIACFHLSDFYRRTLRHRYDAVAYRDRA